MSERSEAGRLRESYLTIRPWDGGVYAPGICGGAGLDWVYLRSEEERMRHIDVVLVALVLMCALYGCKATQGEDCAKPQDCSAGLTCSEFKCLSIEEMKKKQEKKQSALRKKEELKKKAADRKYCLKSSLIRSPFTQSQYDMGRYFSGVRNAVEPWLYSAGVAFAQEADLAGYRKWKGQSGSVTWEQRFPGYRKEKSLGFPATLGEKMRIWPCKELGQCERDISGNCIAVSDQDCRESSFCERFGECTALNGLCIVASDTDCAHTKSCAKHGSCKAKTTDITTQASKYSAKMVIGQLTICGK